eukprot:CAMPEP_0117546826 /NCGR_PEP_ID=MMETSP0784-20121206/46807_1 /TAXON_ID=39447 /ORGANISM="" /LENGTH=192 /DNA_ID=CAMNT_0005343709 /DNA_START=67 /DNA_END=645 /DNA_ORIENTATION=-
MTSPMFASVVRRALTKHREQQHLRLRAGSQPRCHSQQRPLGVGRQGSRDRGFVRQGSFGGVVRQGSRDSAFVQQGSFEGRNVMISKEDLMMQLPTPMRKQRSVKRPIRPSRAIGKACTHCDPDACACPGFCPTIPGGAVCASCNHCVLHHDGPVVVASKWDGIMCLDAGGEETTLPKLSRSSLGVPQCGEHV